MTKIINCSFILINKEEKDINLKKDDIYVLDVIASQLIDIYFLNPIIIIMD